MIALLILAAIAPGFACLCLAMDRHQRDILGRRLPAAATQRLRLGGFAAIAIGLALAAGLLGWGYGLIVWFGLLTLCAMAIVAYLSATSRKPKKN